MKTTKNHRILTEDLYNFAVSELIALDKNLADIVNKWGKPPFWTHTSGFPGLLLNILSQQVSLESARSTFRKLENLMGPINPEKFLSLDDRSLLSVGFSRQKSLYVRSVANEIISGKLDLNQLESMDDDQACQRLLAIKGIGPWTANTYLLFALRRADVWPSGDLALENTIREIKNISPTISREEVNQCANHWKPWRAVAARILWHHYLSIRGRSAVFS